MNTTVFVANFETFLAAFERLCPFTRTDQVDGHRAVIARRRELGSAVAAITDKQFLGGLYHTLEAWGIGSRASRLVPMASFGTALQAAQPQIALLESRTLEDATRDSQAMGDLWSLIVSLGIVENQATLVAGSKALHHILPDLVVPMDRAYTQLLFGWQNPRFQYAQQDCFLEAHRAFGEVARAVDLSRYVGTSPWSTSRTKVVDNAVIGAVCHLRERAG
jgi:hypothetical protein